jgi:hypothetical protein
VGFEPVRMVDARGVAHEFRFRTRLFGPGVAIDAFELRNGSPAGYEFQVIGSQTTTPWSCSASSLARCAGPWLSPTSRTPTVGRR